MLLKPHPVEIDRDLIMRFDTLGPRYTSYPTADRFVEAFDAEAYTAWLAKRTIGGISRPLSLYVHLPFCNTICYYCACNKVLTKDHGRSAKYIRYVEREIEKVSALIEGRPPVTQLHWGGGTPTFLSREEMTNLMSALKRNFAFAPDAEVSIEVDPRKVGADTIEFLGTLGFNRISVGVQDFDPAVQEAVNRVQTEEETRTVIDTARRVGFVSVNCDLIYGLPKQTVQGFSARIPRVPLLDPIAASVRHVRRHPPSPVPLRIFSRALAARSRTTSSSSFKASVRSGMMVFAVAAFTLSASESSACAPRRRR